MDGNAYIQQIEIDRDEIKKKERTKTLKRQRKDKTPHWQMAHINSRVASQLKSAST